MNDLAEALKERIKAPYFGYCFLAFIFINWRAFYILIKTKGLPLERLAAFDAATTDAKLMVWPFVVGGVVFLVRPWVEFFSEYLSIKPKDSVVRLRLKSESDRIIAQSEIEAARLRLLAQKEMDLIERAKRDEEIDRIEDEEIKKELKMGVNEVRARVENVNDYLEKDGFAAKVLKKIAVEGKGVVYKGSKKNKSGEDDVEYVFGSSFVDRSDRYEYLKVEEVLNYFERDGILRVTSMNGWERELTIAGWRKAEELGLLAKR